MLTREQFFAVRPEVRKVEIPALGGSIHVRQLTAGEKDRFEEAHVAAVAAGAANFRARLVAATACDESGVLMFGVDDVKALANLPAHVLEGAAVAAVAVNRLDALDYDSEKKD